MNINDQCKEQWEVVRKTGKGWSYFHRLHAEQFEELQREEVKIRGNVRYSPKEHRS